MIPIYNGRKMSADAVASEPWGSAFLKELDLVVAANVFREETETFRTSDHQLGLRVAERCLPLDGAADSAFMGLVAMSAFSRNDDPEWQQAAETLAAMPRGHWQVWSDGQGFDIWCSNGMGAINGRSGNTFQSRSSRAPGLDGLEAYAATLSRIVYESRQRMRTEIASRTAELVSVEIGQTWKNVSILHQDWSNVAYMGRGLEDGTRKDAWRFRASRRGKKSDLLLNEAGVIAFLDLPWTMPEAYRTDDGVDRTTSLRERRVAAAQKAFDLASSDMAFDFAYGSKAPFTMDGDRLERDVFDGTSRVGSIAVDFVPGTDEIASSRYDPSRLIARNVAQSRAAA
jgi:hypothetical protein